MLNYQWKKVTDLPNGQYEYVVHVNNKIFLHSDGGLKKKGYFDGKNFEVLGEVGIRDALSSAVFPFTYNNETYAFDLGFRKFDKNELKFKNYIDIDLSEDPDYTIFNTQWIWISSTHYMNKFHAMAYDDEGNFTHISYSNTWTKEAVFKLDYVDENHISRTGQCMVYNNKIHFIQFIEDRNTSETYCYDYSFDGISWNKTLCDLSLGYTSYYGVYNLFNTIFLWYLFDEITFEQYNYSLEQIDTFEFNSDYYRKAVPFVLNNELYSIFSYGVNAAIYKYEPYVPITSITAKSNNITLKTGKKTYADAVIEPSDATSIVRYSSQNNNVVSITNYGVITAIGVGTTTVTIYSDDDNTINDTITVTVEQSVTPKPVIPQYTTPKTDWVSTDKFNKEDYNRIKNNISYLQYLYSNLNKKYTKVDLGSDIVDYTSKYTASSFNAFEKTLENLNIYQLELGGTQIFTSNSLFIDYNELNRIESACLELHELLLNQYLGQRTLPATLGISALDNFFNL